MSQARVMDHLESLVICDTQNPPRQIGGESDVFRYCEEVASGGFETKIWDHGDGHVTWYAVRGTPSVLFNVHLDTVPAGEGWNTDPHELIVKDKKAFGRGVCDIKGAAAILLTLAEQGADHLAMLFTSDEEGAGGCCVSKFLATEEASRYAQIIVAEPTGCRAVLGHRGFLSVKTLFHGEPGHSSEVRALEENANHQMARWASAALQVAAAKKQSSADPGSCMNIGVIDGGTKSNVIAGSAFVHWSARLQPGESNQDFLQEVQDCAGKGSDVEWEVPFAGEPLPASGQNDRLSRSFCNEQNLEIAQPVDFWTEASVFSAAGLSALVLGPGHIAQAHIANEWIELAQLEKISDIYGRMVSNDG
jgi:acetylornithine deacetylase